MRKLLRVPTQVAFAALVLSLAIPSIAVAYNNMDNVCWWYNPRGDYLRIYWKYGPSIAVGGEWYWAFAGADDRWTNTPTKVILSHSSSANNTADVYWEEDNKGGKALIYCQWWPPFNMDRFDAKGNLRYSPDPNGETTWKGRVALHEFGHGLGMGHSTDPAAIMYKYALNVDYPGADDIAGLQAMYPW